MFSAETGDVLTRVFSHIFCLQGCIFHLVCTLKMLEIIRTNNDTVNFLIVATIN